VSESPQPADAGAVFGALSDPTRRALLEAIASSSATTATQLAAELPISRQAVVKHLAALSDAGLLERERAGRDVRYHLTPAPLTEAVSWIAAVGGQWDERLRSLERTFSGFRGPMSPVARAPTQGTGPDTG
jgi:DNA-binding transcriptional ArsR family regulator